MTHILENLYKGACRENQLLIVFSFAKCRTERKWESELGPSAIVSLSCLESFRLGVYGLSVAFKVSTTVTNTILRSICGTIHHTYIRNMEP